MLKSERLKEMLKIINAEKSVSTQDLVRRLGISDMTARRYMSELDETSQIVRVHGGAQSVDYSGNTIEYSHLEKLQHQHAEKVAIARRAASLVADGETVYLGPGTTLQLLAASLAGRHIQVVTNSMAAFDLLKNTDTDLLLAAGHYRRLTSTFSGSMTNRALERIRVDKAFFSVNGLHHLKALNHDVEDGETQRLALNNAHKRYLLADHSKFNKNDIYEFFNLEFVDALVTDSQLSPILRDYYAQNLELIVADATQGH